MAVQLNILSTQFGVPFPSAYCRIVTASISRTTDPSARHMVTIEVVCYAIKPITDDTSAIDLRRYYVPLDIIEALAGPAFLEKCYQWLMAQPDMDGAVAA